MQRHLLVFHNRLELPQLCGVQSKRRLTKRVATVLKVKSKTTFKRETQSVSGGKCLPEWDLVSHHRVQDR